MCTFALSKVKKYDNQKGHTNTISIVAGKGRNAAVKYMVFG